MEPIGIEPPPSSARLKLNICRFDIPTFEFGGADRDRTDDLKLAKLALSQLSYGPDLISFLLGWLADLQLASAC